MTSITSDAHFRQRVIKYAEKNGVTKAADRYRVSRNSIYRWKKRYDGSLQSLKESSHRPHHHPAEHTEEEYDLIRRYWQRNKEDRMILWMKIWGQGYSRSYKSMCRALKRMQLKGEEKKRQAYNPKPYAAAEYPGQKVQIDVKYMPGYCGGGYAEYANVKYDMLMPIPKNCAMVEAAAIPEAFATAYLNLFIEGNIKEGDTLLMNAGGSGLASVIIPMAKAFGIRVITTVLTEEIANNIKHLNADRVVVTTKEDIAEVLKEELENGHPIDVAINCLGGEIMGKCIHYLRHGARWIMIAALAGTKTEIDLKNIYVRNVRIIGSTLRSRTPEVKAQILADLVQNVWPKVETGEVKPTIYKVLPIQEAEAAHDILYKGQNIGKVVLTV